MSGLLVSVKSLEEAKLAQNCGISVLDLKNPERGSLGQADADIATETLSHLDSTMPSLATSLALGELRDQRSHPLSQPIWNRASYLKAGPAGISSLGLWQREFLVFKNQIQNQGITHPQWIAAFYIDYHAANSFNPLDSEDRISELVAAVQQAGCRGILLDTCNKQTGSCWQILTQQPAKQPAAGLARLRFLLRTCREQKILTALAGKLVEEEIDQLLNERIFPDLFAVRTAVCEQRNRTGTIDPQTIARLATKLKQTSPRHEF